MVRDCPQNRGHGGGNAQPRSNPQDAEAAEPFVRNMLGMKIFQRQPFIPVMVITSMYYVIWSYECTCQIYGSHEQCFP